MPNNIVLVTMFISNVLISILTNINTVIELQLQQQERLLLQIHLLLVSQKVTITLSRLDS